MEEGIRPGRWCHFQILTQDGPLSKKVCEVTGDLLRLADTCYSREAINDLHTKFPRGTRSDGRMGAKVGSEYHRILYEAAAKARNKGLLEPRLKITRPTDQKINSEYTRRGERSAAGPDFILSGVFDGEDVHAAWDLTSSESIASHFDRDIRGIRRRRRGEFRAPFDPEVQGTVDHERYWSSYIALYY